MKNLFISMIALLIAFLGNMIGWYFCFLVIFSASVYVFGLLLYNAQMLPEFIMAYLDNQLIHGNQKKGISYDLDKFTENSFSDSRGNENIFDNAVTVSLNENDKYLSELEIESLQNLIVNETKKMKINCRGLERFMRWATNVDKAIVREETNMLLSKMSEVAGISDSVTLSFEDEKIRVVA